MYFWRQTKQNEHHHSIQHIHIRLGIRFQLVQRYFPSKAENVIKTIEFSLFQLMKLEYSLQKQVLLQSLTKRVYLLLLGLFQKVSYKMWQLLQS